MENSSCLSRGCQKVERHKCRGNEARRKAEVTLAGTGKRYGEAFKRLSRKQQYS